MKANSAFLSFWWKKWYLIGVYYAIIHSSDVFILINQEGYLGVNFKQLSFFVLLDLVNDLQTDVIQQNIS